MAHDDRDETLKRIQQAFEVQSRALQALEAAMLEGFERQNRDGRHRLLSVQEVSEQLGMGKSWVYNQIRSGELPSVQLGGTVKIKSTAFAGDNGWGPCKDETKNNATGRSEPDDNCGHHEGDDGDPVGEGPKGWWAYYGCEYGGPNNCR